VNAETESSPMVNYIRARLFQFIVYPLVVLGITAGIGWNITVAKDIATLKEKVKQTADLKKTVEKVKEKVIRIETRQGDMHADLKDLARFLREQPRPR